MRDIVDIYFNKVNEVKYPECPFAPSVEYAELKRIPYMRVSSENNEVYDGIRNILINLGLDKENQDTENWNPFAELIKKGQKVLIKPNLVRGEHPYGDEYVESMITNASLMRPIIDYLILATDGDVEIKIGDVPLQDCNWDDAITKSGVKELAQYYREQGINIELVDMRLEISYVNKYDIVSKRVPNPKRNKEMYRAVNLGTKSELMDIIDKSDRFEITDYGTGTVGKHHNETVNEYFVPNEVLEADLFINMPKLKTHRKAGYTCAMKNLIGINGDKSWLAHHTRGEKGKNGDEFNKISMKKFLEVRIWNFLKLSKIGVLLASLIKKVFMKFVWSGKTYKQVSAEGKKTEYFFEGSWYGNDTLWRCIKDLNKIIFYADKNGVMQDKVQRNYLCLVDAIWAGDKEGPMEQKPKDLGVVFGGTNPVYVDYAASKLMRYNYHDLPTIEKGFVNRWWNLVDKKPEAVVVKGNVPIREASSYFEPTSGWKDKLYEVNE